MDIHSQDEPPTELELEEQRAGYQSSQTDIYDRLHATTWMPGIGRIAESQTPQPNQEDQMPDPGSGVPDIDSALQREADRLARQFPHADKADILRRMRETYARLDHDATIKTHLLT